MLLPRQGAYIADKLNQGAAPGRIGVLALEHLLGARNQLADALIPFAVATGDKQASRYSQ